MNSQGIINISILTLYMISSTRKFSLKNMFNELLGVNYPDTRTSYQLWLVCYDKDD